MVTLSATYYVAIACVFLLYIFWMAALSVMRSEQVAIPQDSEGAGIDADWARRNRGGRPVHLPRPSATCTTPASASQLPIVTRSHGSPRTLSCVSVLCASRSRRFHHAEALPTQTGRAARAKAAMNNHAEQFQFFAVGVLLNMVVRGTSGDSMAVRLDHPLAQASHTAQSVHKPHPTPPPAPHSLQSWQASTPWPAWST